MFDTSASFGPFIAEDEEDMFDPGAISEGDDADEGLLGGDMSDDDDEEEEEDTE